MTVRKRILCIHQGGELYGSDRSFLQAVQAMRAGWPNAEIKVVLAVDGPLRGPLKEVSDIVRVRDLCVLRLANPISTSLKSSIAAPYYLARAMSGIAQADLAYINTTVIADYMLAARSAPSKTVIHAREIPKPKAMPVVRGLVRFSSARVIFNSEATERAFALPSTQSHQVIHNGVDAVAGARPVELPETFSVGRPLRVAMLGRISDWKGQDLLIEAVGQLPGNLREIISVRIVGSTFRDARGPIEKLEAQIEAANLGKVIVLEPFQDDPGDIYRWADLCVVPSRLPEPFGRVAIEAMAYGRPTIVAAHGGLIEIVEPGESGWFFEPNDSATLAVALEEALTAPSELARRASAALLRFESKFSANTMTRKLTEALTKWIPALGEAK
jgi:glycosyltransferase involved in cell wall biosynthesis